MKREANTARAISRDRNAVGPRARATDMRSHLGPLANGSRVLSAIITTLLFLVAAQPGWAGKRDMPQEEIPFEEAKLFFELNDTDGDLGIHGLVDGDAWKKLEIEDPGERELLNVFVTGPLRRQGMTEVFFESAEPRFDELPPEKFFRRFPQGEYEISGVTLEGQELESTVALSHVLPAPPSNVVISGIAAAENCDVDPLPAVSAPVTIAWDPVTTSHPEIGRSGAIEVAHYQFIVEREEPTLLIFSVDLPPELTSFEIPEGFLSLGEEFKFEIQVRASNGNQTAVESCFELQ
jgi:hypothetical protein